MMIVSNMPVVRQLGNGTAFEPHKTNTAFTVMNDTILIDCGYNVFEKLLNTVDENGTSIANKIEYIFITHAHDDHIGSLSSFLYWVEFVRKSPVTVFLPPELFLLFDELHKNVYLYPGILRPSKYVRINSIISKKEPVKRLYVKDKQTDEVYEAYVHHYRKRNHGHFYNTSYMFRIFKKLTSEFMASVVFSGDMKATADFEIWIRNTHDLRTLDKILIFHDYSKFTSLDNIHANATDFDYVYSDEFKKKCVLVHTGDTNFKEIWTFDDIWKYNSEK